MTQQDKLPEAQPTPSNAADSQSAAYGYEEIEYVVEVKKPSLLRRLGCGLLLAIWFMILLLPLFFIILAIEGQIRIGHSGDVPDKHEHPFLQVNLIMDADARGLQFINSDIVRDGAENLCIQTNVRYMLWHGQGDSAVFCDCYTRDLTLSHQDMSESWEYQETTMSACP